MEAYEYTWQQPSSSLPKGSGSGGGTTCVRRNTWPSLPSGSFPFISCIFSPLLTYYTFLPYHFALFHTYQEGPELIRRERKVESLRVFDFHYETLNKNIDVGTPNLFTAHPDISFYYPPETSVYFIWHV